MCKCATLNNSERSNNIGESHIFFKNQLSFWKFILFYVVFYF